MKKQIAARLRAWAEKLAPVEVYPQHYGEDYKPVELKARQYILPYVQGEVTEAAARSVEQKLGVKLAPYFRVERVENYDEVYVEGKIIILVKQ